MTHIQSRHDRKRIAVVGSGAAALGAAWLLARDHDVTVFEKNGHVGGHANTVDVAAHGGPAIAVDTGFIVYNERNYPNLVQLFHHLEVPTQSTEMSFAVSLDAGRLEYSGANLPGLFGQPANLVSPRFLKMVADILRFYEQAPKLLASGGDTGLSLGDYLGENSYGDAFVNDHLLPMAAAIWSAPSETMLAFPAISFVRFCDNHGLLQVKNRPKWRTVIGGSREYVHRITAGLSDRIRLNTAVARIERSPHGVEIVTVDGHRDRFDEVVIASHADEALALLDAPTLDERRLLGAFRYQENTAILHGDTTQMPTRRRIWAAWNYLGRTGTDGGRALCVSYWMNRLQSLDPKVPLFVTLNPITPPRDETVHASFLYHHPVFDSAAMAAQTELGLLQGANRTWFCGSYFGYGFHEDAFSSGLAVAHALGCTAPWQHTSAPVAAE